MLSLEVGPADASLWLQPLGGAGVFEAPSDFLTIAPKWCQLRTAPGISIAEELDTWVIVGAATDTSRTAAEVLDPEIESMVRKTLAANEKATQAIDFLRERLFAIPAVRQAYLQYHLDEIDLWALVEGSRLRGQRQVVHEACEAMRRFEGLWIKCHVVPASSAEDVEKPTDVIQLVSR